MYLFSREVVGACIDDDLLYNAPIGFDFDRLCDQELAALYGALIILQMYDDDGHFAVVPIGREPAFALIVRILDKATPGTNITDLDPSKQAETIALLSVLFAGRGKIRS